MRMTLTALAVAIVALCSTAATAQAQGRGSNIQVRLLLDGSQFGRLTYVTHAPGDTTRLFIVEKSGIIQIYNLKTQMLNDSAYLNISGLVGDSGNEQGLLGLAFHPDYQNNGFFYVNYTDNSGNTVIRRFSRNGSDPDTATTIGSLILMNISQFASNHNGGWIGFSPIDGYLYIATGDGGSFCDPFENAQNLANLLGKILRIDVDNPGGGNNYGIPSDNPFVGMKGVREEIYLWGLRNPFRCSFDRETGDLYIGDVGQDSQEEIDFKDADDAGGQNYGWDCREGTGPSSNSGCNDVDCSNAPFVDPIHAYGPPHASICSVICGPVYRGCALPDEVGTYFFIDYCQSIMQSFDYDGTNLTNLENRSADFVPDVGFLGSVTAIGEDAWGEMYIVEDFSGEVFKVDSVVPRKLEDVNCDLIVNVFDLVALLKAWGPCIGCPEDVDGNDVVDVFDLVALLTAWDT